MISSQPKILFKKKLGYVKIDIFFSRKINGPFGLKGMERE